MVYCNDEIKWYWIFVEVSKDSNLSEWILVKALFNEHIFRAKISV